MRLGAIFAGGQARRFGSDKAAALIDGKAMIDHVAARLAAQCDALIVVGREWGDLRHADDWPRPGLGPLGALAGALHYAASHGFDDVLTSGCDLPDLPIDLAICLSPGPSVIEKQPLLGLWPIDCLPALQHWLATSEDRSMRGWIDAVAGRYVRLARQPSNINDPAGLESYVTMREIRPPADPQSSR